MLVGTALTVWDTFREERRRKGAARERTDARRKGPPCGPKKEYVNFQIRESAENADFFFDQIKKMEF